MDLALSPPPRAALETQHQQKAEGEDYIPLPGSAFLGRTKVCGGVMGSRMGLYWVLLGLLGRGLLEQC